MRTVDMSTIPADEAVTTWAPWAKRQGLDPKAIPLESMIEVDDEKNSITFEEFEILADGRRALSHDPAPGRVFARSRRTVTLDHPVEAFPQVV